MARLTDVTITGRSVVAALVIGRRRPRSGGPLARTGALDLDGVGYVIVALFVATWIVASRSGASPGSKAVGP